LALLLGYFYCRFHLQQQVFEFRCPGLLVLFLEKGQFAQMMDIAEGMRAQIPLVTGPAIMDTHSMELGKNAYLVHGLTASFGMDRVMGEGSSGSHMHPDPLASDIQARFVLVHDRNLLQSDFDLSFNWRQLLSTAVNPVVQRARRNTHAQYLLHQLTDPSVGKQLDLRKIHADRLNRWSILYRGGDILRESSRSQGVAVGATFLEHAMLADHDLGHRQINDLAANGALDGFSAQIMLTGGTGL
jgi:hypothetical protein